MSENPAGKKADPRTVYADIIDLPHWQSPTRSRMSLYDRAAQFASYKALSGFEDMVAEEARLTEEEPVPEAFGEEQLNRKLRLLSALVEDGRHPTLTFTVFVPDEKKAGGRYIEITDTVKKIDRVFGKLILMSTEGPGRINRSIDFGRIVDIRGELPDCDGDGA